MNIERYEQYCGDNGEGGYIYNLPEVDGGWVKYDDHKAIVDALEAQIQKLRGKLDTDWDDLK